MTLNKILWHLTQKYPYLAKVIRAHDGFLPEKPRKETYVLGDGKFDFKVVREVGDWDDVMPDGEVQKSNIFDTLGCVTFSLLNILEALLFVQYREKINFSDRYTVIKSGTSASGNTMERVMDSVRKQHGLALEAEWPWQMDKLARNEYFAEIPTFVSDKAKTRISQYKINYAALASSEKEALKISPIWGAVYAWWFSNGYYRRMANSNHATVISSINSDISRRAFDSYPNDIGSYFKNLSWDHRIDWPKVVSIVKTQGFNLEKINELIKQGVDAIMRVENKGQLYELTPAELIFKDSDKQPDSHIPALDFVLLKVKEKQNINVKYVSEAYYNSLFLNG